MAKRPRLDVEGENSDSSDGSQLPYSPESPEWSPSEVPKVPGNHTNSTTPWPLKTCYTTKSPKSPKTLDLPSDLNTFTLPPTHNAETKTARSAEFFPKKSLGIGFNSSSSSSSSSSNPSIGTEESKSLRSSAPVFTDIFENCEVEPSKSTKTDLNSSSSSSSSSSPIRLFRTPPRVFNYRSSDARVVSHKGIKTFTSSSPSQTGPIRKKKRSASTTKTGSSRFDWGHRGQQLENITQAERSTSASSSSSSSSSSSTQSNAYIKGRS